MNPPFYDRALCLTGMAPCCPPVRSVEKIPRGTCSKKTIPPSVPAYNYILLFPTSSPSVAFCYKGGGGLFMEYPMARSSRWPYIRAQAWNRDKKVRAVCHICGEPIDYFVPPSSTPDSYEPDHLIPVSLRPDLELDLTNIAPSHRRCNRQRGDGTNGTNVIGERSRKW